MKLIRIPCYALELAGAVPLAGRNSRGSASLGHVHRASSLDNPHS